MTMNDKDIALYLIVNEPTFKISGKQYTVCSPTGQEFFTWDSDGNKFDFSDITDLLDHWNVDGKPFRDIVKKIM